MYEHFAKTKIAFQNVFLASYEKRIFARNNIYDSENNIIAKANSEISEQEAFLGNDGLVSIPD